METSNFDFNDVVKWVGPVGLEPPPHLSFLLVVMNLYYTLFLMNL